MHNRLSQIPVSQESSSDSSDLSSYRNEHLSGIHVVPSLMAIIVAHPSR